MTQPEAVPAPSAWTLPSRKWMVAFIVGLGALATAFIQAGEWSTTLSIMLVGLVVERASAYLLPNAGSA